MKRHVYAGNEPPYTERYVRWCERTGVSHPLLLDFQPLVGTALGWLVLAEPVSWGFWAGAAFIVAGVLLIAKETPREKRGFFVPSRRGRTQADSRRRRERLED